MVNDSLLWSFAFHYHRDKMNAAVHCAPARFSPITVRLCLDIEDNLEKGGGTWKDGEDITGFREVRAAL